MRRGAGDMHGWRQREQGKAPGNQATCNKAAGDANEASGRAEGKAEKEWGTERCKSMVQGAHKYPAINQYHSVVSTLFELQSQLLFPIRFTSYELRHLVCVIGWEERARTL